MRARWAAATIGPGVVAAALAGGCDEPDVIPYLTREEFAEQAARDCAAMTCDGAQVAIAQVIEEVAALAEAERVVAEEVERACLGAAAAAGVTVEAPTGQTVAERADQACASAEAALAGSSGAGVRTRSGMTQGCGATLDEVEACEEACACAGCPPRAAEATCSGTVVGRCDGTCTGTCWPAEEGGTATCEGECFGRCDGSCSGSVDDDGRCDGVCTGSCAGPCAMRSDAEVRCDGACDACSGAIGEARCITDRLERGWSAHEDAGCAACSIRCVALAAAEGRCLPVALDAVADPPDELLGAIDEVVRACLRLTLRTELRTVLAREAWELTSSPSPGPLCAEEQIFRIQELGPLPAEEGCWAVVVAAEPAEP